MTPPLIRRSSRLEPTPTRRPGLRERRLLTPDDSAQQNAVLIDGDAGAEVELHPVPNSETFYVLRGALEVFTPDGRDTLGEGDLCHFEPGASHGVRILEPDTRFLVLFAPAGAGG